MAIAWPVRPLPLRLFVRVMVKRDPRMRRQKRHQRYHGLFRTCDRHAIRAWWVNYNRVLGFTRYP